MDSILQTIKQLIGGDVESYAFDVDLITTINSALYRLYTLGVCNAMAVSDETQLWSDLWPNDEDREKYLASVRTYVYLKVKLVFDISSMTSYVIQALEHQVNELEWTLNVMAENQNGEQT